MTTTPRRVVGGLTAILVLLAGWALNPGTAQAKATPHCNKALTIYDEIGGIGGITVKRPVYNGKTNCILKSGSSNSGVNRLQYTIVKYYYKRLKLAITNISIDSVYGAKTARAVKSVQKKEGVGADGVYGPKTKNAMCWLHPTDPSWWQCGVGKYLP